MKDISKSLEFFMRSFSDGCKYKQANDGCNRPKGCACEVWSSIWAYINTLIPCDCRKLTIDDFSGEVPGSENCLDPEIVNDARKRIIRYCWGDIDPSIKLTSHEAMKRSVIDSRRQNGNSLVIFGEPYVSTRSGDNTVKVSTRKLGRTLLASIVMKEVVQRRLFDGHAADTYEWVDYQTLKSRLMARDEDATANYQTCDWLVVDNIFLDKRGGDNIRVFAQNMLDSVFMERLDQHLPTILVFQYDIRKYLTDLQEYVGVGMAQIARDTSTFKVSLTKRT